MNLPIDPLYNAYVPAVSSAIMATSRQTAMLLARLSRLDVVKSLADTGSGLSSSILRATGKPVASYDDSEMWLAKTKAFLQSQDLPVHNLRLWSDIALPQADLVFHDLGDMETRARTLARVWDAARRVIVLDDMHFRPYAEVVAKERLRRQEWIPLAESKDSTLDEWGRWALVFARYVAEDGKGASRVGEGGAKGASSAAAEGVRRGAPDAIW